MCVPAGVGLAADRLPMILAVTAPESTQAVVSHHPRRGALRWLAGDETLDPRAPCCPRSMTDPGPAGIGAFAEPGPQARRALVRTRGLPVHRVADRLPDAVRQLRTHSRSTVLVQGAGGGVSTALTQLGSAAGYRIWATSRDEDKRAKALGIGRSGIRTGSATAERVDAVMRRRGGHLVPLDQLPEAAGPSSSPEPPPVTRRPRPS